MFGKNKELKEESLKYFAINSEDDFIQKDVKIIGI